MNLVIEQGRPVRDPEIFKSEDGKVYCRFRLAVERPYRGNKVPKKVDYFAVVCFNRLAQATYNNLAKGAFCTVTGRLETSEYKDKMGYKREAISIVANRVEVHEWLRKKRPLRELDRDFDDELIVPREITNSLFKNLEIDDVDIPDDLMGASPFDD